MKDITVDGAMTLVAYIVTALLLVTGAAIGWIAHSLWA